MYGKFAVQEINRNFGKEKIKYIGCFNDQYQIFRKVKRPIEF